MQLIMSIARCIYGIFVILLILFGIFLLTLHIPLHVLHISFTLPFTLKYIKPLYSYYGLTYVAFVLEYLCGIKFHIYISPQTYYFLNEFKTSHNPGAILLCSNHRTRLDWMMIWAVLVRFDIVQHLITIARQFVRFVPVLGWVLAWIGIFLQRNWLVDKPIFSSMLRVLGSTVTQPRSLFLLFAEGTDLWQKSVAHSHKYAQKHNLPQYEYVLHPRTRGFVAAVQGLNDNLFCIWDATIAYVDFVTGERCNELLLAQGRFCKDVYFYLETFTVDDIIRQYKELYNDETGTAFSLQSYLNKPFYESCGYTKKEQRQKYVECLDGDDCKEELQIFNNAVADFVKKSFERKELRLKEWYESGKWIEDDKDKIDCSLYPRSNYFIVLCMFGAHLVGFVWLWRNMRWYIWLACAVHVGLSVTDGIGKIFRSYEPFVVEKEKERKKKLNRKKNS